MSVIDDYLKTVDAAKKPGLERVRAIVKQTVPDAKEVISYGLPAFTYNGQYLIGFGAFKYHMSVFPTSEPIEILRDKLSEFRTAKGTIQFTDSHPLPESVLKELVQIRQNSILRT